MLFYLRAAALSPILLPEALWVRLTVPILPEPPGARRGHAGHGPPLRVLLAGDSSIAGVGAPSQDDALLGRLVAELESDFQVEWTLEATSGHKTIDTIERLSCLERAAYDVAVTALGVNDSIAMLPLSTWRRRQARLRQLLRDRFGVRTIVVSGLPPVHAFPALPQPLRWHFGLRATEFNRALENDVRNDRDARYVDVRFTSDLSLMSPDGFHPGPAIYSEWAHRVSSCIRNSLV
jgi:lysophospholipase L1-like esterase